MSSQPSSSAPLEPAPAPDEAASESLALGGPAAFPVAEPALEPSPGDVTPVDVEPPAFAIPLSVITTPASLTESDETAPVLTPPVSEIPLSVITPPLAPRLPPKPRPPVVPERTEKGYRTAGLVLDRGPARSCYLTIHCEDRKPQTIYLTAPLVDSLIAIAIAPSPEPGRLWKALCRIPLDRPLPNRQLEEELRVLLSNFAGELRR